jgi:hypothetical protein
MSKVGSAIEALFGVGRRRGSRIKESDNETFTYQTSTACSIVSRIYLMPLTPIRGQLRLQSNVALRTSVKTIA